ncbi:Adenylate kinase isoenzyme 4, mitochondrial, partial [Anas platyrhynchos]
VGVLAKQYLERGLLVPDHVITRVMMSVMMTELEKRRAEHWLLDGECLRTGGSRGPLEHRCAAEGVAEAGERPKVPFGVLLAAGVGAARARGSWGSSLGSCSPQMVLAFPQGIDDLTGEPLVQREDDKPEAVAARLRKYKDAAKPVIELYKSRGILHSFSGTETNKIWPYVYALLSTKIPPLHSEEEN